MYDVLIYIKSRYCEIKLFLNKTVHFLEKKHCNWCRYITFIEIFDMKLFVAGLAGDIDDIDLKEMFELYGEVKYAQVIIDRQTGKSKGFGFVEMLNKDEAKEVMGLLDGKKIFGKTIVVKPAEEQPSRDTRDTPPRNRYR